MTVKSSSCFMLNSDDLTDELPSDDVPKFKNVAGLKERGWTAATIKNFFGLSRTGWCPILLLLLLLLLPCVCIILNVF